MTNLDSILKSRNITNKGLSSQSYVFSSGHVWMWELDYKESWTPKNWCFWTALEKTPELSRVRLFATPDCSLSDSSVHGVFQARVLEWIAISFSRGSSQPRDWTQVSCIAGRCFTLWTMKEQLPLGWTGWISLQSKGLSRVFSNTTVQKHQFFGT